MLSYLNAGRRDYFRTPVSTYKRGVWEFLAVIEGAISPVFQNFSENQFSKNTLWIFPPDSLHGWLGEKEANAEVLVFHFSEIAEELETFCRERLFLSIKLTQENIIRLKEVYKNLYKEYTNMGDFYSLKSRMAADSLSLMICSGNSRFLVNHRNPEKNVIENAISLFSSEMNTGINLNDVAERMGLSIAHLRRLFHKVKNASPRSVFEEIRMERARDLCRFTRYSFGEISCACGFAEQSSFSKAFYRYWKSTPTEMRKKEPVAH